MKIAHSSNRARHSDGRKHKRRVEAGDHCTVPPEGPQPRQREGYDMDQPSVNEEGGAGAGLPVEQTRSPSIVRLESRGWLVALIGGLTAYNTLI